MNHLFSVTNKGNFGIERAGRVFPPGEITISLNPTQEREITACRALIVRPIRAEHQPSIAVNGGEQPTVAEQVPADAPSKPAKGRVRTRR